MASSSQKTLKLNIPPLDQGEEEENDRDWLKLGLAFGDACRKQQNQEEEEEVQECDLPPNPVPLSSAPSLATELPLSSQVHADHHQQQPEPRLGLGLGLGLDNEYSRDIDHHGVEVASCNYLSLCQNQETNYESDPSGSGNFPPMHDDWQLQILNNLHDYSTTHGGRRRRPQQYPGIWFTLQSYTNQNGEELPQIPKAYVRVRDENVTVLMVKKYLLTKLGLSNETEIEILCMGEKLLLGQTLNHVRDHVWLPKLVESVNPTSATSDGHISSTENFRRSHATSVNYLMSLHYGRPDPTSLLKH